MQVDASHKQHLNEVYSQQIQMAKGFICIYKKRSVWRFWKSAGAFCLQLLKVPCYAKLISPVFSNTKTCL